jgi:outer membrane protein assembly factor BamB
MSNRRRKRFMRRHSRLKEFFFMSVAVLFALTVATTEIAFSQEMVTGTASSQWMSGGAWPCKGHDSGRTGQSPFVGAQTSVLKWKYQTENKVHSSPAIGSDGTIYFGSMDNNLYALMPDGKLRWSYQVGGQIYSSPAIGADGTIYVGSSDGKVYALNANGTLKWDSQTGWDIESSPVIGPDGTVYIGSHDGMLYAFNPQDGSLKWNCRTAPLYMYSSPALGADGTVYAAGNDGQVYAINPDGSPIDSDGITIPIWNCQPDEESTSPLVGLAIGPDGTIYVGSYSGKIYALGSDGTLKWSFKTGDQVHSSPAIARDGTIYVGSHDCMIYALGHDGKLKWKYPTGSAVYSSPAIGADGTIYVGSLDGSIYALRPDGSLVWSYKTRAQIYASPAIGEDGTIYITSYDYRIYAFNAVTCTGNDQCPAGSFCQKGIGDCQGVGVCSNVPQTPCPAVSNPTLSDQVCDCNGQDQSSWCQAAANSVSVAHPGTCASAQTQTEVCDGIDNDADGQIDEGLTRPCADGSGTENCQNGQWVGCASAQTQTEVCDGIDNDADGQIDEDLGTITCGVGACQATVQKCVSGKEQVCVPGNPTAEVCDGIDNDCDGLVDEDLGTTTCGGGACQTTVQNCVNGKVQECVPLPSSAEVCDGIDNDCDGTVDEGVMHTYYADDDRDGYGNPSISVQTCSAPSGYVADNTDCDDTNSSIHPGASEVLCNDKDDDCVGGDDTTTCSQGGFVEDNSGALDIEGVRVKAGNEIAIPIRIQSAPKDVHTFSFDVVYDPGVLQFSGDAEQGDLAGSFSPLEINSPAPGRITVSGSSGDIPSGASGSLVWLKFAAVGSQGAGQYSVQLENLGNDLADFPKSGGVLNVLICNGDLNGDGEVSVTDAALVLDCYLERGPYFASGQCSECADVDQDGTIGMNDAKCLFNKTLELPSCLD